MAARFEDFVQIAAERRPSALQTTLAASGLPDHVRAPTDADRAETAVLPWLYRRTIAAAEATPRRLVYVLPMRGPADETFARIATWLTRLGLAHEVGLHLLAGTSRDSSWQRRPERTAILVGTQDLLLSKALMRGFGDARPNAPVSFGLLNNDAQWVFEDEHRLGPGLATSAELQRLRDLLGTSAPTRSTWMSSSSDPHPANQNTADPVLDLPALLALFDNAAEPLDLDACRMVCDEADWTVLLARRYWEAGAPPDDEPPARKDELCQVPFAEARQMLDGRVWIRDALDGRWRHAVAEDLRPGMTLLAYDPEADQVEVSAGPARACVHWVSLDQHLMETEDEARRLLAALPDLPAEQQEAVRLGARYHDLGKCHDVFQEMLRAGGGDPPDVLLAKSKAPYNTGRSTRPHFRHELVSALILLNGDHPWLVTYLAAAHHGRVRVSVQSQLDEAPRIFGVEAGDQTPPVELSTGERFPAQDLQTTDFSPDGSWTQRVHGLLHRDGLGPFRLAYLESLVRVSDWLSSARHDGLVESAPPSA